MPIGEHLNEAGEFVSGEYYVLDPKTGEKVPNVIPIKITAKTALLLFKIARLYVIDDPIFAADMRQAIINAGPYPPEHLGLTKSPGP